MLTLLEEVIQNPLTQICLLDTKYSTTVKALNTWGEEWVEFSDLIILSLAHWTVGVEGEHVPGQRDKDAKGSEAELIWHHSIERLPLYYYFF